LLALVSAVVLACPVLMPVPAWAAGTDVADSRIAFRECVRFGSDACDLVVLDTRDGSAAEYETGGTTWSPDGTRLAFVDAVYSRDESATTVSPGDLQVLDLRTGEVAVLADAGAFARAWFPDGRNLIYTAENGRLHVLSADGTQNRELTAAVPPETDLVVDVSPDGTRVLFDRSTEQGNGQYRIDVRVIDVVTTVETLIAGSAPQSRAVGWSPDGSRVAFLEGDQLRGNSAAERPAGRI